MNITVVDSLANPTEVDGTIKTVDNSYVRFSCKIADRKKAMRLGAMYDNYGADTPSGYWVDLLAFMEADNDHPSLTVTQQRLTITRSEFEEIQRFLDNPMSFVVTSVFKGEPEEPVITRPVHNAIMELQILLD